MSILKDNHYKEKSQGVKHLYEIRKEFNIDTDIAIIGMACRFPGAKNYDEFGNNLLTGINSIKEIPPSRWDTRKYYSPHFDEPNKSMSKWCGLVDNIEQFDNQFFDISPDEARTMDPQQRLLLEETWHCIEDSGVALGILQRKNTSVFIGVMAVDYQQDALSPDVITDRYACLGNYECILANRLSHVFGFQGMSISIDAACASSLIAIHEARHSLIMRESDYALAGGVSLNLHPWKYISFSKSRMLSPDGQCKTFDIGANGYVPGDGVGVILLQRLDDAIIQNNHIYGVIKGSAANHTGRAISITAPRIEAQKKVILAAYKDAGISPETVNYMEADGTGTSLGDLIEVEALTKAFQEFTDKLRFCKLGSVKTNIGNLEGAAGIASVIKVLLMIQHRKIFKSLNIKKLNPIINFDDSPFDVATDISHWKSMGPDLPLRAGVSSFGFGGANSHILLQEFIESPKPPSKPEDNQLFFLSAKSSKSMEQLLTQWKHFVHSERFDTYNLRDMCTTLKLGRVSFPYRYGVHAHTKEELKKLITTAESSIQKHNRKYWCLRIGDFSFEGLAQFKNYLGRFDLFERHLKQIETCLCDLKIKKNGAHQLHQDTWDESVRPLYSFMVAYAGIRTLMDLGFKPDVITGEKAGVLVGLVLANIMKLEDALKLLCNVKKLNTIEFTRPTIPYYDSILKTTVMPFHFDESYLRLMIDELGKGSTLLGQILIDGILYTQKNDIQAPNYTREGTLLGHLLVRNGIITKKELEDALDKQQQTQILLGVILMGEHTCSSEDLRESLNQQDLLRYYVKEVFNHYVDKARLLNTSQVAFKKYLEEWNSVLKKSGRDLLDLLYDDQLLALKKGRLRNKKLLLMFIIMHCLRRLNQQWNLTEQRLVDETKFYELLDLVTDEIMPKEDLIKLLLHDDPDYASISHTLNTRQHNRNLSNVYRHIKNLNTNIQEINDVSGWLINALKIENVLPKDSMAYLPIDRIAFFEIGNFHEPVPFEGSLHLTTGKNICHLFTDSLLQLWRYGVDIRWDRLYGEGLYKKVVLPAYPFDRKSFWLS